MTLQIKNLDQYKEVYQHSVDNPEQFWAEQAETFTWQKKWDKVMDCDMLSLIHISEPTRPY